MVGARQLEGRSLSYTEAVRAALDAGCDLALLCNRSAVNVGAELDEVLDQLAACRTRGHRIQLKVADGTLHRDGAYLAFSRPGQVAPI